MVCLKRSSLTTSRNLLKSHILILVRSMQNFFVQIAVLWWNGRRRKKTECPSHQFSVVFKRQSKNSAMFSEKFDFDTHKERQPENFFPKSVFYSFWLMDKVWKRRHKSGVKLANNTTPSEICSHGLITFCCWIWKKRDEQKKSNLISYYNVAEFRCFCRFQTSSRWSYSFYECLWPAIVVVIILLLLRIWFSKFSSCSTACFSCASFDFSYILISTKDWFCTRLLPSSSTFTFLFRQLSGAYCWTRSGITWKWRINQKISFNVIRLPRCWRSSHIDF